MSNRHQRFIRLNLVQHHVTSLAFHGTLGWSAEVSDLFTSLLDDQHRFSSGTIYSRQKKRHVMTTSAARLGEDDDDDRLWFAVEYLTGPRVSEWTVPSEYQREEEFFRRVQRVRNPLEFECVVQFEFESESVRDLWFPLPTRLGGDRRDIASYELRGVQGIKLAGSEDRADFAFWLARPSNRSVYLSLDFSTSDRIDERLPESILRYSYDLAKDFVGT